MADVYKKRRLILILIVLIGISYITFLKYPQIEIISQNNLISDISSTDPRLATNALKQLVVKGRTPKTEYSRDKFGSDWLKISGCDMRNIILNRDLSEVSIDESCNVTSGTLYDPYTSNIIKFHRGSGTSSVIQIDHVVSLSDAWQKGAQQLTQDEREELANDPLELLAVDGSANQQKSDGDAATWLPSNKSFRCQYIARQIAVKIKYNLWVSQPEHDTMKSILDKCPNQLLPST